MHERLVDHALVLSPRGFLTGAQETEELRQRLARAIDEDLRIVILDCAEVPHMSSYAIGVMDTARSRLRKAGKQFWLAAVDKRIENIFVFTKLSLVFDVYPTVDLALAAAQQP